MRIFLTWHNIIYKTARMNKNDTLRRRAFNENIIKRYANPEENGPILDEQKLGDIICSLARMAADHRCRKSYDNIAQYFQNASLHKRERLRLRAAFEQALVLTRFLPDYIQAKHGLSDQEMNVKGFARGMDQYQTKAAYYIGTEKREKEKNKDAEATLENLSYNGFIAYVAQNVKTEGLRADVFEIGTALTDLSKIAAVKSSAADITSFVNNSSFQSAVAGLKPVVF